MTLASFIVEYLNDLFGCAAVFFYDGGFESAKTHRRVGQQLIKLCLRQVYVELFRSSRFMLFD